MFHLTFPPQLRRTSPPPGTFPRTLVIPPERATLFGLALPEGKWRWRDDGGIEVLFEDAYTLQVCVDATRAIRAAATLPTMEGPCT